MAVTVINLSDTIAQWVTKSNTIATDLGDRASLTTSVTSSLVAAINSLPDSSQVVTLVGNNSIDSAGVQTLARSAMSAGEGIDLSVGGEISGEDASTSNKGVASFAAADFSVSSGAVSLVDITSSHFASPVTLTIYDSSGSVLKTLRSPGS